MAYSGFFQTSHRETWAWEDPLLFEKQLNERGSQKLRYELERLGVEHCLALSHWREQKRSEPRIWLRLLHLILAESIFAIQFAQLVQSKLKEDQHSEPHAIEEFVNLVCGQADVQEDWLRRTLSGLAVSFSHPLLTAIFNFFEKQTPQSQLMIISSTANPPINPQSLLEDSIYFEPLQAKEAVYLRVDLPVEINSNPAIYRKSFLMESACSPMTRRKFGQDDIRPWLEWARASAIERFILILRQHLPNEYTSWLKNSDILKIFQSPLLVGYLQSQTLSKERDELRLKIEKRQATQRQSKQNHLTLWVDPGSSQASLKPIPEPIAPGYASCWDFLSCCVRGRLK